MHAKSACTQSVYLLGFVGFNKILDNEASDSAEGIKVTVMLYFVIVLYIILYSCWHQNLQQYYLLLASKKSKCQCVFGLL